MIYSKGILMAFAIVSLLLSGCAQMNFEKADPGAFSHQALVFVPDAPADEVFHRAMMYMAKTYVSSSDVIQYTSERHGRIIGRAVESVWVDDGFMGMKKTYSYSIDMQITDGKLRVYFDDFYLLLEGGRYRASNKFEAEAIKGLVDRLVAHMRSELPKAPAPLMPEKIN